MGIHNEWTRRIEELQDRILSLQHGSNAKEETIQALQAANREKDELIASMTDDLVSEKEQVLRWSKSIHSLLLERDRLFHKLYQRGAHLDYDPTKEH